MGCAGSIRGSGGDCLGVKELRTQVDDALDRLIPGVERFYGVPLPRPRVCAGPAPRRPGQDLSVYGRFIKHITHRDLRPAPRPFMAKYEVATDTIWLHQPDQWTGLQLERVLAHELVHARRRDAMRRLDPDGYLAFDDQSLARRCLSEGEAMLVGPALAEHLHAPDARPVPEILRTAAQTRTSTGTSPTRFGNLTDYLYQACPRYVAYAAVAGATGLDEAWQRPPRSTEQTLYPPGSFNEEKQRVPPVPPMPELDRRGYHRSLSGRLGRALLAQLVLKIPRGWIGEGWGTAAFAFYEHATASPAVVIYGVAGSADAADGIQFFWGLQIAGKWKAKSFQQSVEGDEERLAMGTFMSYRRGRVYALVQTEDHALRAELLKRAATLVDRDAGVGAPARP